MTSATKAANKVLGETATQDKGPIRLAERGRAPKKCHLRRKSTAPDFWELVGHSQLNLGAFLLNIISLNANIRQGNSETQMEQGKHMTTL